MREKNCNIVDNGIVSLTIIQTSDIDEKAFKKGILRVKRKYGKFKRPIIKYENDKNS
jgi:hypothetical protein